MFWTIVSALIFFYFGIPLILSVLVLIAGYVVSAVDFVLDTVKYLKRK